MAIISVKNRQPLKISENHHDTHFAKYKVFPSSIILILK